MEESINELETTSFFSSLELQSKISIDCKPTENLKEDYEKSHYNDDHNSLYPPSSHTGGKWKPGCQPVAKEPIPIRTPTRKSNRSVWRGLPEGFTQCKDFQCQYCKDDKPMFKTSTRLLAHCKLKHQEYIFVCPECDFTCLVAGDLQQHIKVGHKMKRKKEVKVESCNQCDYSAKSRIDLLGHLMKHQLPVSVKHAGKTVLKYKCPVCGKLLRMSSMRQHVYKHTGDMHYECDICNRQFIQRGSLEHHVQSHFEKEYKCDQCAYSTKIKASLDRHLLVHTDRERPCVCDVCGSEHLCQVSLRRHSQIHLKSGEKPLKCTEAGCGKNFISKTDYAYHMRVHKNESPYECNLCEYKGKTAHQLKKHQRTHTGEKPFKCSYCSYSSAYSTHLTRHLLIHTGAKPYTCPYCNFKCNSIENIRKHILSTKKHSGKRVYPCKYCPESFNESAEFKNHIIALHKNEFLGQEVDIASVITGLYKKVVVSREISDPIAYETKVTRKNVDLNVERSSDKKVLGICRKKKRKISETFDNQCNKTNSDGDASNMSNSCDFTANVPEVVSVNDEHGVMTSTSCLLSSSDHAIPAEADSRDIRCQSVDQLSNAIGGIHAVDSQQVTDNDSLNFMDALKNDATSNDMEFMQLVTFSLPEISDHVQGDLNDDNSILIYI